MSDLTRIDEILTADVENARLALEVLSDFDKELVALIEIAGELFEQFNDCAGRNFSQADQEDDRFLAQVAEQLGIAPLVLIERVQADAGVREARMRWRAMRVASRRNSCPLFFKGTSDGQLQICSVSV